MANMRRHICRGAYRYAYHMARTEKVTRHFFGTNGRGRGSYALFSFSRCVRTFCEKASSNGPFMVRFTSAIFSTCENQAPDLGACDAHLQQCSHIVRHLQMGTCAHIRAWWARVEERCRGAMGHGELRRHRELRRRVPTKRLCVLAHVLCACAHSSPTRVRALLRECVWRFFACCLRRRVPLSGGDGRALCVPLCARVCERPARVEERCRGAMRSVAN